MQVTNYNIKREGREWIGDAVARALNQLAAANGGRRPVIVATIPRILAYFANMPERYEVVEVDVLVETD